MAKTCRHCGHEIDEETFFLNEAGMAADIAAYQKELEAKKALTDSLSKKLKVSVVLAALCFLAGGGLVVFTQHYSRGLGAVLVLLGVGATFLALKARKDLGEIEMPKD